MNEPRLPQISELADLLRERLATTPRLILGVVGAPGSGKSTFAERLLDQFDPGEAVIVPMDGFHLAQSIISGTELEQRRGAPDTFDVDGYVSLLRRLRARDEGVVYAPTYRRGLEEPIAASVAVPRAVPLVITEGNYLLIELAGWRAVRDLLDEAWFVDIPDAIRVPQLIQRHIEFGMNPDAAVAWANGPDARNAQLVASSRNRASRIIAVEFIPSARSVGMIGQNDTSRPMNETGL
ncbi:nucleoside/nucleotide kinase family protein [Rathayibacter soli]|uniref:nucleoside/nucleotide kinase family protein n=1 Tax=Rathayibacter soli TaxID=3144168 RepID=UPI0027E4333A|nr:nucleoside/nucleotide kinase family protein [Glaciibacter superstes]